MGRHKCKATENGGVNQIMLPASDAGYCDMRLGEVVQVTVVTREEIVAEEQAVP